VLQEPSTNAAIASMVAPTPTVLPKPLRAGVRAVRIGATGAGSSFMDLPAFCILTF
jgi:hypothetical protein